MKKFLNWLKKKFTTVEYRYYDVVKEGIPIPPGESLVSYENVYIRNNSKHTIYIGKRPNDG